MTRALPSLAFLAACAGCAGGSTGYDLFMESNYLSYQHAFTDAAFEAVRKNAEKLCGERRQVAVKTTGTCSLDRCTTRYYCVDRADAEKYGENRPADPKK